MTDKLKASKLRKFFLFLAQSSPYLRISLTKWLYNQFASRNKFQQNVFLNYGYLDDERLALEPQDEPNRLFIQLYQRVVRDVVLRDKDIVEVGCGQGAGGQFLLKYKRPRSYVGIDLSEKAIEICKRNNLNLSATWLQGLASDLPAQDRSVDVLVNIESSHCYPSMKAFLSEVYRVLRPKAYMAFTDIRLCSKIDELEFSFKESGLKVIQYCDITKQVLDSLSYLSDRRKAHINATYANFWRRAIRDISAVKNSVTYNGFVNGEQKYIYYLLQKE